MKIKDLTGQVFGKLTVEALSPERTCNSGAKWVCKCECGGTATVASTTLVSGKVRSCGCMRHPWSAKTPQANTLFRRCNYWAKARKLSFSLSFDEFFALISRPCHYCGAAPVQLATPKRRDKREAGYNGIDRVDSNVGYTIENSVPCCKVCNIAKREMPLSSFRAWIRKASAHLDKTKW